MQFSPECGGAVQLPEAPFRLLFQKLRIQLQHVERVAQAGLGAGELRVKFRQQPVAQQVAAEAVFGVAGVPRPFADSVFMQELLDFGAGKAEQRAQENHVVHLGTAPH